MFNRYDWTRIIFTVYVHIINFELILIDFYIRFDWLFSFSFIINNLIKVHIINIEIVHNNKSSCKFKNQIFEPYFDQSHFYNKLSYKHILIIYSVINYHYIYKIRFIYFKHCLSYNNYFKGIIVWGIHYFLNTLDELPDARGLIQMAVLSHRMVLLSEIDRTILVCAINILLQQHCNHSV